MNEIQLSKTPRVPKPSASARAIRTISRWLFDREKDGIDKHFRRRDFHQRRRDAAERARQRRTNSFTCSKAKAKRNVTARQCQFRRGDALFAAARQRARDQNTGPGKLYTLTVMTPNEGFAELIRSGQPVELDEED